MSFPIPFARLRWVLLLAALLAAVPLLLRSAQAAVTVTAATGGDAISLDTTSAGGTLAYSNLGSIAIAEQLATDIDASQSNVTFVLNAPTGFEFNPSAATVSDPAGDLTAVSVANTGTAITVTLTTDAVADQMDTITISNVAVRPTNTAPTSGQIFRPATGGGDAVIAGIAPTDSADGSGGTNFGALASVPGAPTTLAVEPIDDNDANEGTGVLDLTKSVNVPFGVRLTLTDQFDNVTTNYGDATVDVQWSSTDAGATLPGGGVTTENLSDGVAESSGFSFANSGAAQTISAALDADQNATFNDPVGTTASAAINVLDTIGVSIDDVTVAEGNAGATDFVFTVTLTRAPQSGGADVLIDYASADDTATDADDYNAVMNTLTFMPGGGLTQTVTVQVNGDTIVEADETFTVDLTVNSAGDDDVALTDAQGQGIITNDDTATLTVENISATEGNIGLKSFDFVVTLSADVQGGLQVDYQAGAPGNATIGVDFQAVAAPTLTFAGTAAETEPAPVNVIGDTSVEVSETFTVILLNLVPGGGINPAAIDISDVATGTITNDDFFAGGGGTGPTDSDDDGLSDADEADLGTDPDNPDTDGDGLTDGEEVNDLGTDPLAADSDGDGLGDGTELNELGTDPLDADDPLPQSGSDADTFRPVFTDGVAEFDASLVAQPSIGLTLPDGTELRIPTEELSSLGLIRIQLVAPDGTSEPPPPAGLTLPPFFSVTDLEDGMPAQLRAAQAAPATLAVATGVELRLYYDAATVDANRLAVLLLADGAEAWTILTPDAVGDGVVTVTPDADGALVLAERPLLQRELLPGFNAWTYAADQPITGLQLLEALGESVVGVWLYDSLAQAYRSFRVDAPEIANTLERISPRDALLILLGGETALPVTTVAGIPQPRVVELRPGWNQIAYTGADVAVTELIAGVDAQSVWLFDDASASWLGYFPGQAAFLNEFDTVPTHGVLFLRTSAGGTLSFLEVLPAN